MMQVEAVNSLLVRKYVQPPPRHTSYPTVLFWNDKPDGSEWRNIFTQKFPEQNYMIGVAFYIHLPFYMSPAIYNGRNKKITTGHSAAEEYLHVIEKEWTLNLQLMKQTPVINTVSNKHVFSNVI